MVEAERNEAEQHIRNAIGRPASREFTNAFVASARDSYRVKAVCGLSEWILCKKELVEEAFCNGQLDGDSNEAWGSWRGFVDKLKQVKQLPCVTVDYILLLSFSVCTVGSTPYRSSYLLCTHAIL